MTASKIINNFYRQVLAAKNKKLTSYLITLSIIHLYKNRGCKCDQELEDISTVVTFSAVDSDIMCSTCYIKKLSKNLLKKKYLTIEDCEETAIVVSGLHSCINVDSNKFYNCPHCKALLILDSINKKDHKKVTKLDILTPNFKEI